MIDLLFFAVGLLMITMGIFVLYQVNNWVDRNILELKTPAILVVSTICGLGVGLIVIGILFASGRLMARIDWPARPPATPSLDSLRATIQALQTLVPK